MNAAPERLLIATHNAYKTAEFAQMLQGRFAVEDLGSHPELPAVEESGTTFEQNSTLKACAVSRAVPNVLVLADDSGLEVDALGGKPGVRSARYSGPGATDAANRARLLEELARTGARGKARSARFRCVLTLAKSGRVVHQTSGAVEGTIANREKGSQGFGYDPLFIPDGWCRTMGQLPASTKHELSHRARALVSLLVHLGEDCQIPPGPGA